jgi:hypothetical protein
VSVVAPRQVVELMKYVIAILFSLFFSLPVLAAEPKRGRVTFDDVGGLPGKGRADGAQKQTADGLAWLHALIARTVDTGKLPTEAEESKVRAVLNRVLEQMGSHNPVNDLAKQKALIQQVSFREALLERQQYHQTSIDNAFIVANDCRCTGARNSIIFTKGLAHCTVMEDCLVVSNEVWFTGADRGDLLIAKEVLHGTGADGISKRSSLPILVAGSRIKLTTAGNVLYWVIDPEDNIPLQATHAGKYGRAGASNVLPNVGFIESDR